MKLIKQFLKVAFIISYLPFGLVMLGIGFIVNWLWIGARKGWRLAEEEWDWE